MEAATQHHVHRTREAATQAQLIQKYNNQMAKAQANKHKEAKDIYYDSVTKQEAMRKEHQTKMNTMYAEQTFKDKARAERAGEKRKEEVAQIKG
jgi:hypothetical protein